MNYFIIIQLLLLSTAATVYTRQSLSERYVEDKHQWKLCSELVPQFTTPCLCTKTLQSIDPVDGFLTLNGSDNNIIFNCDNISLPGNFPVLPLRFPAMGYSHRFGGFHTLERQLFSESEIPLVWLDFSHNHLQRLTDRLLEGVRTTLEELALGHNRLGYELNPIFATSAFKSLPRLKILDLSYNMMKALDDGLFTELDNLRELNLAGNNFILFPKPSLKNLRTLAKLSLENNQIDRLHSNDFSTLINLESLNISHNAITAIETGAFSGLLNLTSLDLSSNKITTLNKEEIFSGLDSLLELDLSDNFLHRVPSQALRSIRTLTVLRLSSNGIRDLRLDDFAELSALELVDLSRNRITDLPPTVFSRLTNLKDLILDVNLVRNVDEPAFDGLQNLKRLSMNDNTILGLPTKALASLPSLTKLAIGYNRIAAISPDLLRALHNLHELRLEFNLVREIPDDTFQNFTNLRKLSFRGNHVGSLTKQTFIGTENTLLQLDLATNGLETYPTFPVFAYLEVLDLSDNYIAHIPEDALAFLPSIKTFNLMRNRIKEITHAAFNQPQPIPLERLNLGSNGLNVLPKGVFSALTIMKSLDLSDNNFQDIEEGTFQDLSNLRHLDLSRNSLNTVRLKAFGSKLTSLCSLNVSHNQLTVFDGGIFEAALPRMEVLDLSNNRIHYIIPNSLSSVATLQHLNLIGNRLTVFSEGILSDLPHIEILCLRNNHIQQIDGGQFSHARRLRHLDLSHNKIEAIGEGVFYNSSQVRLLSFSHNRLATLSESAFDGLARLELDLSHNDLKSLPVGIFAHNRVANLQSIDLSNNQFNRLPLASLNEQYANLEDLVVSDNHISHVPANANSLVNVKRLDMSNNPLNEESLRNIFNEPKTVRELKLAGCGIKELPELETPFVRSINISNNSLTTFRPEIFQRTTLLESLDLSGNKITNLSSDLSLIWPMLTGMKHLDLSRNPIQSVGQRDISPLTRLESLSLSNLHEMGRFDDQALMGLTNLKRLAIEDYPRLGFYDVRGILAGVPFLESLEVEVKAPVLRDQLHTAFNPRLRKLMLHGKGLRNLTSVSFAGLLAPSLDIAIHGTNIATIPNTILLPLPTSAYINFDLSDNRITVLGPQLLMTLSEKRHQIRVTGLESNPLYCDCLMKPMHKWLQERISTGDNEWKLLQCSGPPELKRQIVWELHDEDLTCERPTTTTTTTSSTTTAQQTTTTTEMPVDPFSITENEEPDIIYEAPSPRPTPSDNAIQGSLTNMDSMIIGIIVGVVAFICILIVIICLIKLRQSRIRYHEGPMQIPPMAGACTCMKHSPGGPNQPMCHCHPNFPPHPPHHRPLSPKLLTIKNGTGSVSSLPRSTHCHSNQPYYVTYPESDIEYR